MYELILSNTVFNFKRFIFVGGQLAHDTTQIPPSEGSPPLEYIIRITGKEGALEGYMVAKDRIGERAIVVA